MRGNKEEPIFNQVCLKTIPSERLSALDLAQADIFEATEIEQTIICIEGCQVINPPVVRSFEEKKKTRKEWRCTFVAPPDLWHQERDDWIQAVTENKTAIIALNKLKLNHNDMCTVIGVKTGERDEPMAVGRKQRHITFIKVTEIVPGVRGSSKRANVLQPKARFE